MFRYEGVAVTTGNETLTFKVYPLVVISPYLGISYTVAGFGTPANGSYKSFSLTLVHTLSNMSTPPLINLLYLCQIEPYLTTQA